MSSLRTPQALRYKVYVEELKRNIDYRGMRVGEQKALLTAIEMKEPQTLISSIIDIVSDCVFDEDVSKLPMHIVDFLFLHIYMKAAGNMARAQYICGGTIEKPIMEGEGEDAVETGEVEIVPCASEHILNIDLGRAQIKYPDDYVPTKLIEIGEGMVVKMRMPTFEVFRTLDLKKETMDVADQFIFSSIECIVDGDDVKTPGIDFSVEEMVEWINTLDVASMKEITEYLEETPSLYLMVNVTCPKCGREEVHELQSLEDFFG